MFIIEDQLLRDEKQAEQEDVEIEITKEEKRRM
jgi:hypothetical protein